MNNKGFTLVQLVVTAAVIVVLAGTVLFGEDVLDRRGRAQDVQRHQDITALAKAVELYQIDNGMLPTDLANANIDTDQKLVLCSSSATLSCDGQNRDCLVVDDSDLLNTYLGGALPVDPQKSATTDTGYYITRTGSKMTFGACTNYEESEIEYVVKASLADYADCGNGEIEGDEVCDDGNTVTEYCGDGVLQKNIGTYCNSQCTGYYTGGEKCDYNYWSNECWTGETYGWFTDGLKANTYCSDDCLSSTDVCLPPP